MINIDDKFLQQIPFAEGGEGILYEYGKDCLIKVYKPHIDLKKKSTKIKALMNKTLPQTIIKPIDIVNKNGKFIGYTMKKVSGEDVKRLSNKKHIKLNNIKYNDILKVLVAIKDTLNELHRQNIYIGDLNDTNVIFDKHFNVFFIDCDSWSIDTEQCDVCMDSFKDPLLVGNNFSDKTDAFAYAILIFKSLTKIHPYGGVTKPDMDILERMSKGICVIDNKNVVIPKTIPTWNFIPPKLLGEMKEIFENIKRFLIDGSIEEFYENLKQCPVDKEYYYSKFNECPFCNNAAKVYEKPQKVSADSGAIIPILYFSKNDVKIIVSPDAYVDMNDSIVHMRSGRREDRLSNCRYYFSNDGEVMYEVWDKHIEIHSAFGHYKFEKTNGSIVNVVGDKCYYINLNNSLVELTITKQGNSSKIIAKCAFNNIFKVFDEKNYFVCSIYDGMKILNISGYNYTLQDNSKILGYGIHFDDVKKQWLFIYENDKGKFETYIFDKNNVVFHSDTIKYSADLANICFNNGIIFTPCSGLIRGFAFDKNIYKDFDCAVVDEDSQLIKAGKKFTIINEKEIYSFG